MGSWFWCYCWNSWRQIPWTLSRFSCSIFLSVWHDSLFLCVQFQTVAVVGQFYFLSFFISFFSWSCLWEATGSFPSNTSLQLWSIVTCMNTGHQHVAPIIIWENRILGQLKCKNMPRCYIDWQVMIIPMCKMVLVLKINIMLLSALMFKLMFVTIFFVFLRWKTGIIECKHICHVSV